MSGFGGPSNLKTVMLAYFCQQGTGEPGEAAVLGAHSIELLQLRFWLNNPEGIANSGYRVSVKMREG